MLRPVLTAGLTILALAAPAAADGVAEPGTTPPAGYGGFVRDERPRRPADAPVRRDHRAYAVPPRGVPVRPVSYGETDGAVFHAWLPRNTNLPIYNIPPPFFREE